MEITTIISILIFLYFLSYCMCDSWHCTCGRNYVTCSNNNCLNTAKQYIGSRGTVTVPPRGDRLTIICNRYTEAYVMPIIVQCNVCTDEVFPNNYIPTCVQQSSTTATTYSTSSTRNKTEEITLSTPHDNYSNITVEDHSHHQSITQQEIGLIIMAVVILVFVIVAIALAWKRCACNRKTQVVEEVVYDYAMIDFIPTSSKEQNKGELDSTQDAQQSLRKRPMLPIPLTNYEDPMDALSETPYTFPVSEEN